jgi:hypothetical protein
VEFGKFSHNLHYVDYERLPIAELSRDGGSIPHNYEMTFEIRQDGNSLVLVPALVEFFKG